MKDVPLFGKLFIYKLCHYLFGSQEKESRFGVNMLKHIVKL